MIVGNIVTRPDKVVSSWCFCFPTYYIKTRLKSLMNTPLGGNKCDIWYVIMSYITKALKWIKILRTILDYSDQEVKAQWMILLKLVKKIVMYWGDFRNCWVFKENKNVQYRMIITFPSAYCEITIFCTFYGSTVSQI